MHKHSEHFQVEDYAISFRRLAEMIGMICLFVVIAGCQCISVPSTDSTPPIASIFVEFREPGGSRVSRSLREGDADIIVTADMNDVIVAIYSGSDNEGMRKIELEYDMIRYSGNTVIQPLLLAEMVTVNCPKPALLGKKNFGPGTLGWKYDFATRSDNWLGQSRTSGKIIMQTR